MWKIFHDSIFDESLETRDDFSFGGTDVGVRYSVGGRSEDGEIEKRQVGIAVAVIPRFLELSD